MSVRTVDPVTQEIVGNALASIADEMATTIFRTAHSTVVRDGMDFSAALCDATGETVAQAVTVPFHLGAVPHAMACLLDKWGDRMQPGDVFVMNDPFDGGIHLQDIFVFKPVYFDGGLIGFATTTAHHADVGGRLPGSAACDNTEIFQEGIRLPWLRLYDRGEPVETVFEVIRANVRIPRMTLGDLSAQVAATSVAERELQRLAARYG
ncbi:MAG TPA: hydantoinase B/oxoprolinase family protein, partial [Gaiellaceae bacterium]